MIVQSRGHVRPLCDRHVRAMLPVTIEMTNGLTWHLWACEIGSCTRHYSIYEGYFDFIAGKPLIDPGQVHKVPCPEDGTPMYLENYERQRQVESWRCAQVNCKHVQQIPPDVQEVWLHFQRVGNSYMVMRSAAGGAGAQGSPVPVGSSWDQVAEKLKLAGWTSSKIANLQEQIDAEGMAIVGPLSMTGDQLLAFGLRSSQSEQVRM